jgi:hypothetical protein
VEQFIILLVEAISANVVIQPELLNTAGVFSGNNLFFNNLVGKK